MALSYPLSLPATKSPAEVTLRARPVVGLSTSPFSFAQQAYVHQGEMWEADVVLPPMKRANAEPWIAFLLALNGRQGTMLLGPDTINTSARGTWVGSSPLVRGGSQTGKTLEVDNVSAGVTALAGDWFSLGTGSSTRLHKIVQDATANGSGQLTLEIWPRLRSSPADNAALTIASPKGVFRLASNVVEWSLQRAQLYGIRFSVLEAL